MHSATGMRNGHSPGFPLRCAFHFTHNLSKIQFGNNTNIANYKALSKAITDANAELESMVKRFLSEGEAGKQKIRSLGGLDPSKH